MLVIILIGLYFTEFKTTKLVCRHNDKNIISYVRTIIPYKFPCLFHFYKKRVMRIGRKDYTGTLNDITKSASLVNQVPQWNILLFELMTAELKSSYHAALSRSRILFYTTRTSSMNWWTLTICFTSFSPGRDITSVNCYYVYLTQRHL